MNFIRYQNESRTLARESMIKKISCGNYGHGAELHAAGGHKKPEHHTIWIPDGMEITTSISVNVVNGELVASPEEDVSIYFWVSGARGPGHGSHKQLLVPPAADLLAAGAKEAHQRAWCNKITSAIFRVPKGTRRVVIGDHHHHYKQDSQAIIFTSGPNGDWTVAVEPYDRFCALNPNWTGLWAAGKDGRPPLPLPALVE